MTTILDQIVAENRKELRNLDEKALRRAAEARAYERVPHSFRKALEGAGPIRVIAEIKSASPSAGTIVADPDVESIAAAYRDGGASAISIVTEPRFFRGSRDWIDRASSASGLPVIMKDFIIEAKQIHRGIAAGADAVLLIAALLSAQQLRDFVALLHELERDALVEVHDEEELLRAISGSARIIGVNSRNLRDFSVDLGIPERLAPLMPVTSLKVAESGIRTRADVERIERAGFDAILVGESLLRSEDRAAAVRELL